MTVANDMAPSLGSLGDLFAFLWLRVSPHVSALSTVPWLGGWARECASLRREIEEAVPPQVPQAVRDYLAGLPNTFETDVPGQAFEERAFVVMCAIDGACEAIHPSPSLTGGMAKPRPPGAMMSSMRQVRFELGFYGACEELLTVPKGPLLGRREDGDQSGDRLDIHFGNLAAMPSRVAGYSLVIDVIPPRSANLSDPSGGPAVVGTAAIAVLRDDLSFESSSRNGRSFLDARPRDEAALAAITAQAVSAILDRGADVVVLPELCMGRAAVAATADRLRADRRKRGALLVLGSGLSEDRCPGTGMRFNECNILDASGRTLWRQRKMHHFRMGPSRMRECMIPMDGTDAHSEDTATGTVLEVRDLPGLGRTFVLICEDLQQPTPGGPAAFMLRPDWIFSPILDTAQGVHRWAPQRAIELSRASRTRVVVSCSGILEERRSMAPGVTAWSAGTGYAVLIDDDAGRRCRIVTQADCDDPGGFAVSPWEPANWFKYGSVLSAAPTRA